MTELNQKRIQIINDGKQIKAPVIYWMTRENRIHDNWSLIYAQKKALESQQPLIVIYCLADNFLNANNRHYDFLLQGLNEVKSSLKNLNINFFILNGSPETEIPYFIDKYTASLLITDFDPLKIKKNWVRSVSQNVKIPFHQVDSHNIVPCWTASQKQEFGAYTIRPKIERLLLEFLTEYPVIQKHPYSLDTLNTHKQINPLDFLSKYHNEIKPVNWIKPGYNAAIEALNLFINTKLDQYTLYKNDPTRNSVSNLSVYLHFGQISSQRIALEIEKQKIEPELKKSFLEELIIRKELSDNYCYYNENYDNFSGFPQWAQQTLNEHKKDKRDYIYNIEQFENFQTHDQLWNAAQRELSLKGKMHGYMRMYWAKKILEWTNSPEEAQQICIYLNDKYSLDGRDPNGYTGIAWSIGGVHDRAWANRPVFGKIRYMNDNGCKRKFSTEIYIKQCNKLK